MKKSSRNDGAEIFTTTLNGKNFLNDYYEASITRQIAFSDWYAHYKFFYQAQYEWIDEQKRFTWKDKFPLTFRITVLVIIIVIVITLAKMWIWN